MATTIFPCEYCPARLASLQGLCSHVEQSRACRQKQRAQYLPIESGSESDEPELPNIAGNILASYLDDPTGSNQDFIADPPLEMSEDNNPCIDLVPSDPLRPPKCSRVTVEEVEDEDDIWVQYFPQKSDAGKRGEECETPFEKHFRKQKIEGQEPWDPFQSEEEWDLARWLMTSGIHEGCKPSFHNNRAFLKFIDALPRGPAWHCQLMELTGDEVDEKGVKKKEVVELWFRDPLDCICELLGNPAFRAKQGFVLHQIFRSAEKENWESSKMWTASWWWEIQKLLTPGATLGPVIISSDKTQLTKFSGDQQAWPVYLTIGNIDMETHCAPSSHATILLGYIPVTKLEIFDKKKRSAVAHQLFHDCMCHILALLKTAGEEGVEMECTDGFPTLLTIQSNVFLLAAVKIHVHIVWLHQGPTEILPMHHGAIQQKPWVYSTSRPMTGNEHKNMEKIFLSVIADTTNHAIQCAAKGALDFIYYSHFKIHCDESLTKMDVAWAAFHSNKQIFINLAIRKNFNINKLHKLKHYTNSICSRGTAAGFNTEAMERLHIDLAKVGYKATNKKWAVLGYTAQPAVAEDKTEEEDSGMGEDEGGDADTDKSIPAPSFSIPKTPHFPSLTTASISTDFHAPNLLHNLTKFLVSKLITPPMDPTEESTFPVYKHVAITLPVVPEVTRHVVQDKVHAGKSEPMKITLSGMRHPMPGQFNTVLVRTRKWAEKASPIDGLGVARVWVIFKLPEQHGNYPDPLVYIDWFKPLTTPVPNLEMQKQNTWSRSILHAGTTGATKYYQAYCQTLPVLPGDGRNWMLQFMPYLKVASL
ncbi:hypothetical protein K438DRAFT_1930687 [Mycena galopus ATCC 62051]|nr:hypothetical protein K438DRAFT_1930687 [Mycena galopus ATCC 62051]